MRYVSTFKENLAGFDFETLENSAESIFALSSDLALIYFNQSYLKFADENSSTISIPESSPIGTKLDKIVPEVLYSFYSKNYTESLNNNKVWHHEYECSSDKNYRIFKQTVYPLKNKYGLLIVNKLRIEKPFTKDLREDNGPNEKKYTQVTGFINQCSNCRCIQQVNNPKKWDWVSFWVKDMPKNTSHTICPVCFDFYWKYAD